VVSVPLFVTRPAKLEESARDTPASIPLCFTPQVLRFSPRPSSPPSPRTPVVSDFPNTGITLQGM
jgi:hypothetical protein